MHSYSVTLERSLISPLADCPRYTFTSSLSDVMWNEFLCVSWLYLRHNIPRIIRFIFGNSYPYGCLIHMMVNNRIILNICLTLSNFAV